MTPAPGVERRSSYIELHERVATLEAIGSQIRTDIRDTRDDIQELQKFLAQETLPPIHARLASLELSRRIVHAVWGVLTTLGIALAWLWDHVRPPKLP